MLRRLLKATQKNKKQKKNRVEGGTEQSQLQIKDPCTK